MLDTDSAPLTRLRDTLVAAAFAICFVLAFSMLAGQHVFALKGDDSGDPFFIEFAFRLWPTTQLVVASFLIALPLGFAASRLSVIGRIAHAVPLFWLAVIGGTVVAMLHRGDPMTAIGIAASDRFDVVDRLVHVIGPASILAFYQLPSIASFFARRSAGNGARPLAGALFGLFVRRLPEVVGATLVVEVVFAWPGISRMFMSALRTGDAPALAGIVGAVALVTLALRAIAVRDV